MELRPTFTMAEVYGPEHVYAPRAHPKTSDWIIRDPAVLDGITGNQLPVAGDMEVVCSAGATTEAGLELLREAGLDPAASIHSYNDERHAIELASRLAEAGRKIVVQHIYPSGVLNASALWIDAGVLSYLNNKANLAELVPKAHVAPRQVVNTKQFFGNGAAQSVPIVLKVATDLSTGGGIDVAICRTAADVEQARGRFEGAGRLIAECLQPVRRDACLHYAVMPEGSVRYLGFADQDIAENGCYRGNWLALGQDLCDEAVVIGREVAKQGSQLGYRGLLGIDLVENEDGAWIVLDLNFRVNGSTAAVLLAPAIERAQGFCCLHLRGFRCDAGFQQMVAASRAAIRSGRFIPVGTFDAKVAGYTDKPCRVWGLVVGESRADITRVESELMAGGLV